MALSYGPVVSAVTLVDGDLPSDLLATLRQFGQVAVDTETGGLSWSSERLELCQLFTPSTGPVLVRRFSGRRESLATLLEDPFVLKAFHFAPFDLPVPRAQSCHQVQERGMHEVCIEAAAAGRGLGGPQPAERATSLSRCRDREGRCPHERLG